MPDSTIVGVTARRIWDSRGRPTVEAEMHLADGTVGRGIAPAGASRGSREAVDRRDGGTRLGGLDVGGALGAIRDEIAPALRGLDAGDQGKIDARLIALDGTPTKARLGGNAIVAVSLAALQAAAAQARLPLWAYLAGDGPVSIPVPEIQIFGGGAHAGRRIDIQDLMVVAPKAESFEEALVITAEVYRAAGRIMVERGALAGVADEGGWWPAFASNEEALDTLVRAIEEAGYTPGQRRGDLTRCRGLGVRSGRTLPPGPREEGTRQRRAMRPAARLVWRATRSSRSRTRSARTILGPCSLHGRRGRTDPGPSAMTIS